MQLGLHIIAAPSGRFIYVGSIPAELCTLIPATKSDVLGGRAFRERDGELVTYKTPSFDTHAQAAEFAQSRGCVVQP